MSIIERISAQRPVRRTLKPRTMFALLLAAAALCGCARHYDLIMTNNRAVTNVRIRDLNKHLGYFTCVTATGREFRVPAGEVTSICPHGDTNRIYKED
jgi:hypothetical protein